MGRRCGTLQTTLEVLREAGLTPEFEQSGGGHYKIRCAGLPHIVVSSTPRDSNAAHQARRYAEKFVRMHVHGT